MSARFAGAFGALSGVVAVALGAFAAHALRARLEPAMLEVFETAARYQLVHAVALLAVAALLARGGSRAFSAGAALFAAGTVLFAGSLYALALTGVRAWGAVTPLGGACLIAGWLAIAIGCLRSLPPRA
jgi:uncharacterized membrane protein YgdD (TMEM256/DUF423 family)